MAENFTRLIASGGYLCFEFGLGHVAVSMILQEYGYTDIVLRKDLRGVIRAAAVRKIKHTFDFIRTLWYSVCKHQRGRN
ncbi:MAG: hypothetical protein ACLT1T_04645 [Oscillospiraceae bacterium]